MINADPQCDPFYIYSTAILNSSDDIILERFGVSETIMKDLQSLSWAPKEGDVFQVKNSMGG